MKKRVMILLFVLAFVFVVCLLFGKVDSHKVNNNNNNKREDFIFSKDCKNKEYNFIDKIKNN